ncbi:MAG: metal-dependent hydrolase [Nanoarchaeota archaeon]|nr:metal-dependent hydrolase [Nanoarchaeota archaeon]
MAHAVTHVLLAIIAVDIYRHYFAKKKFSLFFVYLTGFFALVPDIDIPIGALLGMNLHGTVTHWVWWPLIAIFIGVIFLKYYKNKAKNKRSQKKYHIWHKSGMVSLFIGIGLLSHLLLDCAFGGYQFFYPFAFNYCPTVFNTAAAVWADAIILISWLFWEWRKHNIKDFV